MKKLTLLAVCAFPLFGAASPAPGLAQVMVDIHNRARDEVGVPPITWDTALAAQAQGWANHLARLGRLEHSQGPDGENLAVGQGGYSSEDLAGLWTDEKANFVNGVMPDISRTGQWWDTGHYSQMVWSGTTRIGCAEAGNPVDGRYLVCRYAPAGNVIGQRAY